jgi:uncharacterized Fe-S center protein
MKKIGSKGLITGGIVLVLGFALYAGVLFARGNQDRNNTVETTGPAAPFVQTGGTPKVYYTTDISPAGLTAIYEALGRKVSGKVAVKISTGEPGGHHFLSPDLIKDLVWSVNGAIVESNTLSWAALSPVPFPERRITTALHRQVAIDHGFAAIAPVDILDEDGSLDPVALDKACVDLIYVADTQRSAALRERIESRNGTHILDHAESLGLGVKTYELIRLD